MAVVDQLDQIYQDGVETSHKPRYEELLRRFRELYGCKPAFYCRAPGRVNIIGEHIDYCGYSVLPAALEQDFIMAYSLSDDDKIVINNVDGVLFPTETVPTDPQ